jgi:hypothetical protein
MGKCFLFNIRPFSGRLKLMLLFFLTKKPFVYYRINDCDIINFRKRVGLYHASVIKSLEDFVTEC